MLCQLSYWVEHLLPSQISVCLTTFQLKGFCTVMYNTFIFYFLSSQKRKYEIHNPCVLIQQKKKEVTWKNTSNFVQKL